MGSAVMPHKEGLWFLPRVDALWHDEVYQGAYRRLGELERDRAYCRHGVRHLMDTARIMWILNLERGCGLDREVVYAAALLHDIGKAEQYEQGTPHEEAGVRIAGAILDRLPRERAFTTEERAAILTAIQGHRRLRDVPEPLERLLYQADKASRTCFACPADVRASCSWSDEKKNLAIMV